MLMAFTGEILWLRWGISSLRPYSHQKICISGGKPIRKMVFSHPYGQITHV
jgi:hypothetical protein